MMHMKGKTRRILVVLRVIYSSQRDILYGIADYARLRCRWHLHIVNLTGEEALDEIRRADAEGVDGIISCGLEHPAIAAHLQTSRTPLVCICSRTSCLGRRKDALAFVNNNDFAIGSAGAEYLAKLGRFRSYGFVSRSEDEPSYVYDLREQGFRSYFAGRADDVRTYRTAARVKRSSFADIAAIAEWLRALPKPAAVMAAHDLRATHVIEAADMAEIKIPQELAVIGVDNDELYCETANPTITSLAPDHARLGELAAKALKQLMAAERGNESPRAPQVINLASCKIMERQSTKPVSPASQLVERAIAFIRQNATRGISAVDVSAHLGVSRRLADLRFRQMTGTSILGAILNRRFDEVKRHLRDSNVTIEKIIASCGFKTASNAKNLFRKHYGMSMSEFRNAAHDQQPPSPLHASSAAKSTRRRDSSSGTPGLNSPSS